MKFEEVSFPVNKAFDDLTGKRFGKLLVLSYAGRNRQNKVWRHYWNVVCDCGKKRVAAKVKYSRSCGCMKGPERVRNGVCSVDGCGRPIKALGYCNRHWLRMRRNGDPLIKRRCANGEGREFIEKMISDIPRKDECVIWPFGTSKGYGWLSVDGKSWQASRYALVLHTGINPEGLHAAHGPCHNKRCVNPHHLRWATPEENSNDRARDGTSNRGDRHGMSKLTRSQVQMILERKDISSKELSRMFGVTYGAVSSIRRGKSWSWLQRNQPESIEP